MKPRITMTLGLVLGLSSHAAFARSLSFEWQAADGPSSGYRLYLKSPGALSSRAFDTDAQVRKVILEEPLAGEYRACVVALSNSGQEGPCSELVSIMVP